MAISEINDKSLAASAVNLASSTVTGILPEANTVATLSPGNNLVINGAMKVAQRSASETGLGAASGYFTLDRWRMAATATAGRFTMTQDADGPNGISANCLKLDCTTADTSIAAGENLILQHRFEGQNLQRIGNGVAGAKQITVSFYVKANAAFTFGCELYNNDNTRQMTKLFATTTGWVRHELTFPADVDDGSSPFDDDNATSLALGFWLHAGATYTGGTLETAFANVTSANRAAGISSFFSSTDNNFFITGVQLEVGPVATPFEHLSYGEDSALCKRYYEKSYGVGSAPATSDYLGTENWSVNSEGNGNAIIRPSFTVEKRAAPTIVGYQATGTSGSWNYERSGASGTGSVTFDRIGANGSRAYVPIGANWASAYLFGHWTADAEL